MSKQLDEEETNSFFKFWYERFLVRFSFVITFCAFLGVFVYAFITEIMLKSPGSEAPFMDTIHREDTQALQKTLQEMQTLPLNERHLSDRELKSWITMVISEAMFFNADSFDTAKQQVSAYFTGNGLREYENYLTSSGILKSLKDNNYRMSIIIEEAPLFMNGVEIEGVYRWLYQLPVTISFIPVGVSDLRRGTSEIVNRKLTLRIQIRRIRLPDNPDAIQIESWTMNARRGG